MTIANPYFAQEAKIMFLCPILSNNIPLI